MTYLQLNDVNLLAGLLFDELDALALEPREQHFVLGAQDVRDGAVQVSGVLDRVREGAGRLWPHLRHPLQALREGQVRVHQLRGLDRDLAHEVGFLHFFVSTVFRG